MAVSKRLRFEILRRDNHTCRYCGAKAPDVALTVDHVVPVSLGGQDVPENLVAASGDCNGGKSSATADAAMVADVAEDAIRWRKAMEIAQEMAIRESTVNEALAQQFFDNWNEYTYFVPNYRTGTGKAEDRPFSLPHDWSVTVSKLASEGMFGAEMVDAIAVAMARSTKDKFAYFVGVVRNKIRDRQDVARDILDRGEV